ncbi:trichohyalin isoform X2 [Scyliorhinus canicula]|uniref:trichohyalin isoform X2 n=1 Tax=Scyliorhinus canicula TaxID=7830 RepID=UPI0018F727A4|nr:trichohyalin isoform X2 [Scyliorhinus canicula]
MTHRKTKLNVIQECEELKKTNTWLAKELQLEKVLLRSESERTMRNLRVLNQEMHATIKELRQKTSEAEGRAALSERLEKEAVDSLEKLDYARELAESQEKEVREERNKLQSLNIRLQEEIGHLQDKLTDVQHRLTQTEQNYLETKSLLDRRTGENELKLDEIRNVEFERDKEVLRRKDLLKEVSQLKDREAVLRRVAVAAEQASDEASRLQYETERYRRLAEYEREEKSKECELWRQKHNFLSDILRSQDEEKAKRKNKACQAKLQTYLLCRAECDQRLSVAKTNNGIPKSFVEGEAAHFTDTDDRHHIITPERQRRLRQQKKTANINFKVETPSLNTAAALCMGFTANMV